MLGEFVWQAVHSDITPAWPWRRDVAQVVIEVRRGKLGVRGAVAGGALQAAVADGEAIERKVQRRAGGDIGRGGEGLIRRHAQPTPLVSKAEV